MSHQRTKYFRVGASPPTPTLLLSSETPPADPSPSRSSYSTQAHYPLPSSYNSTPSTSSHSPCCSHSYSGPRPCTKIGPNLPQHTLPLPLVPPAGPLEEGCHPSPGSCTCMHKRRSLESLPEESLRTPPDHRANIWRVEVGRD